MTASLNILDPRAPPGVAPAQQAWRPPGSLRGKVVGFIDNSKPNFNHLVDDLAELLVGGYGVARVIKHRKLAASIPAPDPVLQDVEAHCDLVIAGSGD